MRLLVVDDASRQMMEKYFVKFIKDAFPEVIVHYAQDFDSAEDMLLKYDYDVLLVDKVFPTNPTNFEDSGKNGLHLLERLDKNYYSEKNKHAVLIFQSDEMRNIDIINGKRHGAHLCIQKQYDAELYAPVIDFLKSMLRRNTPTEITGSSHSR